MERVIEIKDLIKYKDEQKENDEEYVDWLAFLERMTIVERKKRRIRKKVYIWWNCVWTDRWNIYGYIRKWAQNLCTKAYWIL